ncbi:DUF4214 domain-containing protein [Sphingomonas sp.]|jgi:Ca2+-binding RTX toxin-like protein|uniref:DUF4214 domain-containing protein n=1 Tax=Sphingomonas sp. TaxID=28214 RepID=UPI002D7EA962|nr:DUF4214 domain-containing protein [Sphingomonas sp.]HEU0043137.1 DUF4214 domain-containing protein [Sphingomonas sp.]
METITGTEGDDTLEGTLQDDTIKGLGGNDVIRAGRYNGSYDLIEGGDGNDTIYAALGSIAGGAGDDRIVLDGGNQYYGYLDGGSGYDTLAVDFGSWTVDLTATGTNMMSWYVARSSWGYGPLYGIEAFEFTMLSSRDLKFQGAAGDESVTVVQKFLPYGLVEIRGGDGNDVLRGSVGVDSLHGEAGDDRLLGGEGDDVLDGGGGINMLVGGPGDDRLSNGDAYYLGFRRQYAISDRLDAGVATHSIGGGTETGTDTLTATGRTFFIDGQFDYGTGSVATQVARLYDTAFDRAADQDGLNFWSNALNKGVTPAGVAQAFLLSGEAAARGYAALSNAAFVDRLFRFSVDHAAGADSATYVAALDGGTATRA